jgi:hypothetical protein
LTPDEDLLSFALPAAVNDLLPALPECATDILVVDSDQPAEPEPAVHLARLEALGLRAVLPRLAPAVAHTVMFHAASVLGRANLPVAWQQLGALAAPVLGVDDGTLVGILTAAGPVVRVPLLAGQDVCAAWFPAHGSGAVHTGRPAGASSRRGLVGLPHGALLGLTMDEPSPGRPFAVPEAAGRWAYCHALVVTLLLGLLDGACARLVEEAFRYARQGRHPAPPLAHHQAVGLRLGDIAIRQQELNLTLRRAVEVTDGEADPQAPPVLRIHDGQVARWATGLARESLQVGAARAYVAGLPFRRLVEQVNSILGAIADHRREFHRSAATDGTCRTGQSERTDG